MALMPPFFSKWFALLIWHAVRAVRLADPERLVWKQTDTTAVDITGKKDAEMYMLIHTQGWCADRALQDNHGNNALIPTQAECEALCNEDPQCHYIAYGWAEHHGGYFRCASFETCSFLTDYRQGSLSVFAKPVGRYTLLPTYSWCMDGSLVDNDRKAATIPTLSSCEAICNSDPHCHFIVFGWVSHHEGFFRCATFSTCNSPTVYLEGAPNVYEKPASHYEVSKTDSWCMDGALNDNNGRAVFVPTLVSCEAFCDSDPRCNFIAFGWVKHHGGFYRCATFPSCDHPTKYLEGDPRVYAKPREIVSEVVSKQKNLEQDMDVSKAVSNHKNDSLEHEVSKAVSNQKIDPSGSFTSEGSGWKRWCSFKDEESLACKHGTVLCIKTAFYSRTSDKGCKLGIRPPQELPKLKTQHTAKICHPNVVEKLKENCHGQTGCTLPRAFHDTCNHNPFTYIRVTFACKESCEP